ncbi:transglutaminase TgpA family protein [Pelomicrobium sp.]|jgi:transglutaminase-like putative cysteine protease|uniref:transglutaminase TgpA family protein n=1 Tax=Pelomicrobium sp. TaxID=2815319 RepID=UPI002FDDE48F
MSAASLVDSPPTLRQNAWLLLTLGLAVAPHLPRLPLWMSALVLLLGLWRWYLAITGGPLPPRLLLFAFAGAAVAGTALHYGTLFGPSGGVALFIVLVALKLLESRSVRDAVLLVFLGYFLVITLFLYDQSMSMAAYTAVPILGLTTLLAALAQGAGASGLGTPFRTAAALLLQAFPVMVILFLFFPRLPQPLWGVPQETAEGVSGLSDVLAPGDLSRLSLSDAVAFRVDFQAKVPPPSHLYWRGPVLTRFDGRTWSMSPSLASGAPPLEALDGGMTYTVTLEPHHRSWLFALELPGRGPEQSLLTPDYQLVAQAPVRSRIRYTVTSYLRHRAQPRLSGGEAERALALPAGGNPRARALALGWKRELGDASAIVQRALQFFRTEDFFYTLQPPRLGREPVDDFLFNTRRGYCEHYASSFVFLMRAAGVPARVVTGYQGGEFNPLGGYLIVRQADAHAWAEVWLESSGWLRVDPTAAVAPERVERGLASVATPGEPLSVLMRSGNNWARPIQLAWDSLTNGWNQWVLGYGGERQRELLSRIGVTHPDWRSMAVLLLVGIGAFTGMLAAGLLWRMGERRPAPAQRLYRRFCRRLARHGLARAPGEGPRDYANRIAAARPELAAQVQAICWLYIALRYGTESDPRQLKRLRALVGSFRL